MFSSRLYQSLSNRIEGLPLRANTVLTNQPRPTGCQGVGMVSQRVEALTPAQGVHFPPLHCTPAPVSDMSSLEHRQRSPARDGREMGTVKNHPRLFWQGSKREISGRKKRSFLESEGSIRRGSQPDGFETSMISCRHHRSMAHWSSRGCWGSAGYKDSRTARRGC